MEVLNLNPGYQLIGFPKGYDGKYSCLEKLTHHVLNYLVGPYVVTEVEGSQHSYFKISKNHYLELSPTKMIKILTLEELKQHLEVLENNILAKIRADIEFKVNLFKENSKMISLLLK